MCGFVGILSKNLNADFIHTLTVQNDKLSHRGPNASGLWASAVDGIYLAHRRLSIQDLSSAGHQPMLSHCKRFVIVYNGEIYNFLELRQELESMGESFSGHSDTEVLLRAISCWGLNTALYRLVGMFAFAIWDIQLKHLTIVRDRIGIKPVYYGIIDNQLIFASELKALTSLLPIEFTINQEALSLFLQYSYVPSPLTIYNDIYKVKAGEMITFNGDNRIISPRHYEYWNYAEKVNSQKIIFSNDTLNDLDFLITDSVAKTMLADVPVGVFLSGGIDSSLVAAKMQQVSAGKVKSFCLGYKNKNYDESVHAKRIAEHIGSEHHELILSEDDIYSEIVNLPHIYDEPFADSSQLPTYILSKFAKSHVDVCLSGDGGDEIFAGYNRHLWITKLWNRYRNIPLYIRKAVASLLHSVPLWVFESTYNKISYILPKIAQVSLAGEKINKLALTLPSASGKDIYLSVTKTWQDFANNHFYDRNLDDVTDDLFSNILYWDTKTYLPDDILTKVDRASMAVSLETRVPLLDHRIVEYAAKIPGSVKTQNGTVSKWLLRKLVSNHIPEELYSRPKMGFGVPICQWLRGPLKSWAEDLLSSNELYKVTSIKPEVTEKLWQQHLSLRYNNQHKLWNILMLSAWLKRNNQ